MGPADGAKKEEGKKEDGKKAEEGKKEDGKKAEEGKKPADPAAAGAGAPAAAPADPAAAPVAPGAAPAGAKQIGPVSVDQVSEPTVKQTKDGLIVETNVAKTRYLLPSSSSSLTVNFLLKALDKTKPQGEEGQ